MNFEEKTVSSEEIYDGKIIKVRKEKVELPDGRLAMRELIGHPGGVGIIAVDGDGKVFMVTQYRICLLYTSILRRRVCRICTECRTDTLRQVRFYLFRLTVLRLP